MISEYLKTYAKEVRKQVAANPDISEPALAPAFQKLVADLLPHLATAPQLTVSPEYNKPGIGRPDIALIRQGEPPRAFIELKAPAKPGNPKDWKTPHDKRQFERLQELAHWGASNFHEFRLFARDKPQGKATIVPPEVFEPETGDKSADALIDAHNAGPFLDLLGRLASAQPPVATNPEMLAELLAHSARIVRSAVKERVDELEEKKDTTDALILVKRTYRNVLYAHPEAGGYSTSDFNELFASAFAQTLAFGLLLVREHLAARETEEERQKVGSDAYKHMPDQHPLMKGTLEAISDARVIESVGIGFDVMLDTLNSFDPAILKPKKNGRDPILYFYEDFLSVFDPKARERYGVYYTPLEVVRFMVGALDRVLREDLKTKGLHDPEITILDPATGTGTFLLGIAERVRDRIMEEEGGPAAGMALKNLAERMFGFELLIGPYAVAHYRLHHALANRPPDDGEDAPQPVELTRLGIYLADTLSRPDAITPEGNLGFAGIPIDDERRRANDIKTRQRILAIIGNPPYRRLAKGENETLVGRWMDEKWQDLKDPVSEAGKGGELKTFPEFSVAFWRWAMWKLFEAENAPQKGVIAFITNRKYLTGWPYAGLRKMMRERFDRLEIFDLRGDINAGARAGIEGDQGVFNIRVGTAICVATADGSKGDRRFARILYSDSWEYSRFTKSAKLDWLDAQKSEGEIANPIELERGELEDFRPEPFQTGNWVSLREAFDFSKSGMKSGDDDTFVSIRAESLPNKLSASLSVRADPSFRSNLIQKLSYRPLDNRFFYNDTGLLNRAGPEMQRSWGDGNVGFYSLKSNTSTGPSTWSHTSLPDYHAIKGSNGGYAFPLYDRRKGPDAHNFNPAILTALAEAYGEPISPEDLFDAILALLSATSYTMRFAEDLEDTFPHIPFPADPNLFRKAAAIGAEIRALEGFQREPAAEFRPKDFVRLRSEPKGKVELTEGMKGEWFFCDDETGRFDGLSPRVWEFAVSGYRVLKRWVDAREGLDGATYWPQFRDVAARIHELLHWFDQADLVLEQVLGDTLSREELGLVPEVDEESEDEAGDDG